MEKEPITVDEILAYLQKAASDNMPLPPDRWVDAGMRLQSLLGNEMDSYYLMEHSLAKARVELIQHGMKLGEAKMHVEASDEYFQARKQKGKIERVTEIIRLAKLRGRMASEEQRAQ